MGLYGWRSDPYWLNGYDHTSEEGKEAPNEKVRILGGDIILRCMLNWRCTNDAEEKNDRR